MPWQAIPVKNGPKTNQNLIGPKVFWRIKGLTIRNESEIKVKQSPEGLSYSKCNFFNGFSDSALPGGLFYYINPLVRGCLIMAQKIIAQKLL